MKYILELIFVIIVVFFVWNILKRLFFRTFYKIPFGNPNATPPNNPKEKVKTGKSGLNWDAETVDYEEVKEEKNKS